MTPSGEHALPLRMRGGSGSAASGQDVLVTMDAKALLITRSAEPSGQLIVPLASVQGAARHADGLVLAMSDRDAITLDGSAHLDGFRNRLEAAVCVFPAQTLSLRGFGSERSAPGSDHDRWFDALLAARRLAEESRTIETQRRAFDSARLARHAQETREAWAAERFTDPADRRALAAELEELAAPYSAALRQLEHAALRLRQAPDEMQFATWRRWTAAVQRAFRAADDVWTLSIPALADSRGAQGSFWRRLLRSKERRS